MDLRFDEEIAGKNLAKAYSYDGMTPLKKGSRRNFQNSANVIKFFPGGADVSKKRTAQAAESIYGYRPAAGAGKTETGKFLGTCVLP